MQHMYHRQQALQATAVAGDSQGQHSCDNFLVLLQEAMARQAPTYAAHIAQIRQQAVEETAAERERLQGQLSRVQAEMKRLQSCNDADRQATQDLMEVEKIQVGDWLCLDFDCHCDDRYHDVMHIYMLSRIGS